MTHAPERRHARRTRHARQAHRSIGAALSAAGLLAASACTGSSSEASAPSPAPASPSPSAVRQLTPDVKAQLDKAVTRVMHEAAVPGAIVGLWAPGNGTYVRTFGVADKGTDAPMSTGLNMRIGSETKTFTVTAILRLVDQGKLGLDDPVSKYVAGVPEGDRITLRQLAEMRSGLFSYSEDPDFDKAFISDPQKPFTPRQLLGYAFRHPNLFPPGKQFQYSNTNAVLLGLVVEKVTGRPFRDYLREQVLAPAHLNHTVFPAGAEFPDPHAHGYTDQTPNGTVADATGWNPSWGWTAGAMISTLDDLHAWAPILAKGTLLKPATQAERLKTLPTWAPGATYGLGIFNDHGWLGHNGSLPGYQSLTVYLPSADATLVVLINTDVSHQGNEPSTLFGQAITKIMSPENVFTLPAEPTASPSPTSS